MASAETSDLFLCSPEQFFRIVTEILKTVGQRILIEYTVSVMKDFKYTLWMNETSGLVAWEFASGDIFKTMKGYWKMADEGGKCRATYNVEATFGLFVPGPIAKALVNVNLPNMLSAYHKRVAELYGR